MSFTVWGCHNTEDMVIRHFTIFMYVALIKIIILFVIQYFSINYAVINMALRGITPLIFFFFIMIVEDDALNITEESNYKIYIKMP